MLPQPQSVGGTDSGTLSGVYKKSQGGQESRSDTYTHGYLCGEIDTILYK